MGPGKTLMLAITHMVMPILAYNPLGDSGIVAWVRDPANDWQWLSVALILFIFVSSIWIIHGAITFAVVAKGTFALAMVIGGSLMVALVDGGKFDPFDLNQSFFAAIVSLVILSTLGRVFAQRDEKEDTSSAKKGARA
jgi:hypothetical protein